MKSFFIVLHLLTVSITFGQTFALSKFENCDNDNTYQKIILNFQNQNDESIILKLNKHDYLTIGNDIYSHYIVDSESQLVLDCIEYLLIIKKQMEAFATRLTKVTTLIKTLFYVNNPLTIKKELNRVPFLFILY